MMENQNASGTIAVEPMKQTSQPNGKELRIIDRCSHFLGSILNGRVYIYCGRCKKFVLVHKH